MKSNKVRIISYVTPALRESLSVVAKDEAASESAIVTRALLCLFREFHAEKTKSGETLMDQEAKRFFGYGASRGGK